MDQNVKQPEKKRKNSRGSIPIHLFSLSTAPLVLPPLTTPLQPTQMQSTTPTPSKEESKELDETALDYQLPQSTELTTIEMQPKLLPPVFLEVGGGTGSFAAFIFQSNLGKYPELADSFYTSDYQGPEYRKGATLKEARNAGVKNLLFNVDANELGACVKQALGPESVDIILCANPYGYGVTKMTRDRPMLAHEFIWEAIKLLKPRGSLIVVSRSNLLFSYMQLCKKRNVDCPYDHKVLKQHNLLACGIKGMARLSTANADADFTFPQLEELQQTYNLWIEFRPIAPPKGVVFTAFADDRNESIESLHGFNVQVVLTKLESSSAAPPPALTMETKPFWEQLEIYTVVPMLSGTWDTQLPTAQTVPETPPFEQLVEEEEQRYVWCYPSNDYYDVGKADDDGNCFYDAYAQLMPALEKTKAEMRQRLADSLSDGPDKTRIAKDKEYATDEDLLKMANLDGVTIVVHSCSYQNENPTRQQIGSGELEIHLLYRYDSMDTHKRGHYDPMRLRANEV